MNLQFTLKLSTLLFVLFYFTSCEKDDRTPIPTNPNQIQNLGWSGTDDVKSVPVTTNFSFANGNIPSKYDIDKFLPPVGDQGQYGTCVAWAAGYNMQTALEAIKNNLSKQDLSLSGNQYSPKDLFWAIPSDKKR